MDQCHTDSHAGVVLVVEDELLIRMSAADALADEGYEVLEAEHAHGAIEVLEAQAEEIDVVFTDVTMPGAMDGIQLAHHAQHHWPDISVIVTSAHPLSKLRELPHNVRFIPKPYATSHVVRHLREIMGG